MGQVKSALVVMGFATSVALLQIQPVIGAPAQNNAEPVSPPKVVRFGAIAVDKDKTGSKGFVSEQSSRADASRLALERCRNSTPVAEGCRIALEFSGSGCGAVAFATPDGSTPVGWGLKRDALVSRQDALNMCRAVSGKPCDNLAQICNFGTAGQPTLLYAMGPSKPKVTTSVPGSCIVRFQMQVEPVNRGIYDPIGYVYSPVYILGPKDCPYSLDDRYNSFSQSAHEGDPPRSGGPGSGPLKEKGMRMVADFAPWVYAKRFPAPNTRVLRLAKMYVADATPFWKEVFSKEVGSTNIIQEVVTGKKWAVGPAKWSTTAGYCLDYAPKGVTPLEVLGQENCTKWIK